MTYPTGGIIAAEAAITMTTEIQTTRILSKAGANGAAGLDSLIAPALD